MNQHTKANKDKIVNGLSDALGFAKGADNGERITISSVSEFFVAGVRFNPGRYEIRKIAASSEEETGF